MTHPPIRQVSLVMTERCNFSCPYCYQSTHSGPVMGREVINALVSALEECEETPQVHFFGGEPLLAFDEIREAVFLLRKIGVRDFSITTNASLITKEKADFLRANEFTVIVSMDGGAQAQSLRQPNTYEKLKEKVALLLVAYQDRPAHISVHAVVTAENVGFLADSVAQLCELGFRRVALSPVFDEKFAWSEEALRDIDREFTKLTDFCIRHYRLKGWIPLNKWDGTEAETADGCGCALVNGKSFSVHTNGDLSTCLAVLSSKMPEKLKASFKVGRIFDGFPDGTAAASQCQSVLDKRADGLSVIQVQRGKKTDTYGCPLSVLLATDKSHLRHHEVWKMAEQRLIESIPKRRKVFGKKEQDSLFRFTWSSAKK